jgi:NAD(P)-dependent dehydrogenase (short-subunit alcohol dehydrogenase family)
MLDSARSASEPGCRLPQSGMNLDCKVALITAAGGGTGRETAIAASCADAPMILNDICSKEDAAIRHFLELSKPTLLADGGSSLFLRGGTA